MKKLFTIIAIIFTSLVSLHTVAQPLVKRIANDNAYILSQADKMKLEFAKDGFELSTCGAMTMESNNELPVIIALTAGTNYRIVFIADNNSTTVQMKLVDLNNKQIATNSSKKDKNSISFDYTANTSAYHMIKPVQTNNNSNQLSGYFMVFKK